MKKFKTKDEIATKLRQDLEKILNRRVIVNCNDDDPSYISILAAILTQGGVEKFAHFNYDMEPGIIEIDDIGYFDNSGDEYYEDEDPEWCGALLYSSKDTPWKNISSLKKILGENPISKFCSCAEISVQYIFGSPSYDYLAGTAKRYPKKNK